MSNNSWSAPTTPEEVARRAGGRTRYNACRGVQQIVRRWKVLKRLADVHFFEHGILSRIAAELGVSRSTVCRDRQALLAMGVTQSCPHCGKPVPPKTVNVGFLAGEMDEPESDLDELLNGDGAPSASQPPDDSC